MNPLEQMGDQGDSDKILTWFQFQTFFDKKR